MRRTGAVAVMTAALVGLAADPALARNFVIVTVGTPRVVNLRIDTQMDIDPVSPARLVNFVSTPGLEWARERRERVDRPWPLPDGTRVVRTWHTLGPTLQSEVRVRPQSGRPWRGTETVTYNFSRPCPYEGKIRVRAFMRISGQDERGNRANNTLYGPSEMGTVVNCEPPWRN